MTTEQQERTKLELAAKQLTEIVGSSVGWMLSDLEIVVYGDTKHKREQIYKTLEGYGYHWDEKGWVLTTPAWINELVAEAWVRHETIRD